jgi:hypothetical protein
MGNTATRPIGSQDRFPISARLSSDLDKLSSIAMRILSTPELYDINNLAKPGVCGEYAVFLKKDLKKRLMPFVTKLTRDGSPVELVYGNPRGSIKDDVQRKEICSRLADTMLRTIMTVVASLASIQIATPAREAVVAASVKRGGGRRQKGGTVQEVSKWLIDNGFATVSTDNTLSFVISGSQVRNTAFTLQLTREENRMTYGYITGVASGPEEALPAGALRIHFLKPIQLAFTSGTQSCLPMRIVDSTNVPWIAGILFKAQPQNLNVFKSFYVSTPEYSLIDQLLLLFRRTQGWTGNLVEDHKSTVQANEIFQNIRDSPAPTQTLVATLSSWFASRGYVLPAQPPPVGPYGVPPPPPYGYGYYPGPAPAPVAQPTTAVMAAPLAPRPLFMPTGRPGEGAAAYLIPESTTKAILDTFKRYQAAIPRESSPALVRANTLVAAITPDREWLTGVCKDPYYTMTTLANIYPWASFQFLATKKWETITSATPEFDDTWGQFLSKMRELYNGQRGRPQIEPAAETQLSRMRFRGTDAVFPDLCKQSGAPRVDFKEAQGGLLALQGIYEEHVKHVWAILNKLIYVVADPETGAEVVQLHPRALDPTGDSVEYVEKVSKEALTTLMKFYLSVEETYLKSIDNLKGK